MSKLIFGCGYLGSRVAPRWWDEDSDVNVVTRSPERAAKLQAQGYRATVADVTQPESLADLPKADAVLFAVGFDRTGSAPISEVYADGVRNVLAALPAGVRRFIYISSTGVYGPAGGDWVDEHTSPNPLRDGGKASLAAEQHLAAHPLGKHSLILRLAGIYGPERIPYLDKLRAGEPVAAPSKGWLNLIHVDDAASVVLAGEQWLAKQSTKEGPHIFCVSDGEPVVRGNYYREVARLLDAPQPKFSKPDSALPASARAAADKRISNKKCQDAFHVPLAYPSYREGLASILASRKET